MLWPTRPTVARLAERGHGAVRAAHGTVFQYLDDAGTTVTVLAERARMTKQSMGELVRYLEQLGYGPRGDSCHGSAYAVVAN